MLVECKIFYLLAVMHKDNMSCKKLEYSKAAKVKLKPFIII